MAGENTILSVKDFGMRRVVVTRLSFGVDLHSPSQGGEDQSRTAKQFHTARVRRSDFTISLVFSDFDRYTGLMEWLERYVRRIANPDAVPTPMRVTIPSYGFDRLGILNNGIQYGERAGDVTWRPSLTFTGSRNPLDLNNDRLRSKFVPPEADDPALIYLYPAGEQLAGFSEGRSTQTDPVEFDDFDEDPDVNTLLPPFRQPIEEEPALLDITPINAP